MEQRGEKGFTLQSESEIGKNERTNWKLSWRGRQERTNKWSRKHSGRKGMKQWKREGSDAKDEDGWATNVKSKNNKNTIQWSRKRLIYLCAGLYIKYDTICVYVSSFSQRLHGTMQFSRTCKYCSSKHCHLTNKVTNYFITKPIKQEEHKLQKE